jgi:malate dehydrogenase (oxaloacetate-decarboxylating)(NADP+)
LLTRTAPSPCRYVFPGIGLGASLSGAARISDRMIEEASLALADSLTADEKADDLLYPRIERIREISAAIAVRVIETAQQQGLDSNEALRNLPEGELAARVAKHQYKPESDACAVAAASSNGEAKSLL